MATPLPPQLLGALSAERAALHDFCLLLEQEQDMLVQNHSEDLIELAERKTRDAVKLNALIEARHRLLEPIVAQQDADSLLTWLKKNAPQGSAIWQEIVNLGLRASELNRINGELIQIKLRHNQQRLIVLSNAVNKASVYGRNGQPDFSAGSGRTLGSG